ncbi:hypothetical protein [Pseudovibrio sp. POLY-S9]|uniref:hypothetical protein n=1 Tax=Pseudovibrio sp. POLY-S9 TaxID=1576596 RepID=UPI00070E5376|nr:hypothetical protein [Pseudovibrio sp. POLY-S9]
MASTNATGKFFVSVSALTPGVTYTAEDFQQIRFIEITDVGSLPESGTQDNMVSYNTIDKEVSSKSKGVANAGDGSLEVAHNPNDKGQDAIRAHAATSYLYATAHELPNAPNAGSTGTVRYNLARIGGPANGGGGVDDFIVDTYALGFTDQRQVEVKLQAGVAPTNNTVPSIDGEAEVGKVLSVKHGTWNSVTPDVSYSYQWKVDGADVANATGETYTIEAGASGKTISCKVTATNQFGSLEVDSSATAAVS